MSEPRSLSILLVLGLAVARPGGAQELESFDLSDFLDPQLLAADPESDTEEPVTFLWSRFTSGFLDGYQRRDLANVEGTAYLFARLAGSLHYGRNQVNCEILGLDRVGLQDDQIADLRLQFARYFYTDLPDTDGRIPARAMVSWRSAGPEELGFQNELSLSVDIASPLGRVISDVVPVAPDYLFGSYVYAYQPDRGDHYLTYASRATVKRWAAGPMIRLGLAAGVEHVDDHTRWGTTRLELSFVSPLPIFNSNIHLVYGPAYHPNPPQGHDHFGYELGVFSDIPLWSKLFARSTTTP